MQQQSELYDNITMILVFNLHYKCLILYYLILILILCILCLSYCMLVIVCLSNPI